MFYFANNILLSNQFCELNMRIIGSQPHYLPASKPDIRSYCGIIRPDIWLFFYENSRFTHSVNFRFVPSLNIFYLHHLTSITDPARKILFSAEFRYISTKFSSPKTLLQNFTYSALTPIFFMYHLGNHSDSGKIMEKY